MVWSGELDLDGLEHLLGQRSPESRVYGELLVALPILPAVLPAGPRGLRGSEGAPSLLPP